MGVAWWRGRASSSKDTKATTNIEILDPPSVLGGAVKRGRAIIGVLARGGAGGDGAVGVH